MQQSLVLMLAAALGSMRPFIVTGTIQVQNVTNPSDCIPFFVHFLNTNAEIFLPHSAQRHLLSISSSFLALHSPFPIFCFGLVSLRWYRSTEWMISSGARFDIIMLPIV